MPSTGSGSIPQPEIVPEDFLVDEAGGSLFGYLVGIILFIVPLWKIFGKAGFSPAWSLLIMVPFFGSIAALSLLAFRRWPATEGRDVTS
jgi:hypothetical protein